MELRQLRYVLAVAEELHFGRAAAREHVSQPPLSQQIRALEEELGVRLFRRTSRRVALTEAGQAFLAEVRPALAGLEWAAEAARQAGRGETGRLVVGFVGPAMDGRLPGCLRTFRERWPLVALTLRELPTHSQLDDLRAGRLDIGIVRLYRHDMTDLVAEPFQREPYVLALPDGHPLASRQEVALADLRDVPLVMYPRQTQPALYDAVLSCCAATGFSPTIVQEAESKQTALALVAANLGAALVPASSGSVHRNGVVIRRLAGPLPVVEIAAVRRAGPASQALLNFLGTLRAC